ncbi:hypothetical protein Mp_2g20890 [Marchantia polymorpha subsp. ruderalis]|uniref:Uncharacterized protein n=1 Tax=Marchantia polymorpha TaxID=3197 RepID=A0A2R6X2X4_MARPO|nr:hypothetical protein MARPO_0040s0123 [Marchantia polymorpha]PTQ40457.1 hypothetical protein MARPO_0040s0123 [Marchantia polymorpha]BBN03117.1 hypothetical protein Mp_2g20890 [Marchantia polymorpha subsp. ruderalis]BBN03118.1 hypothetical protein Mp_2g20890 [Marchantia polymorpha subsp. ruderalis]|eukprot:PTQ40455.1 hypothetical protein MARPO_0040s0123 [Marchantia polymorpha]
MAKTYSANSKIEIPAKEAGEPHSGMSFGGFLGSGGTRFAAPSKLTGSRTGENFKQLKLTAEKMMQEQASIHSELQIMKNKFLNSEEQVQNLELKMQDLYNENAKLKVERNEDMNLWNGLDSKFLATTTFCDHLAETLRVLEVQLAEAEQSRKDLEEKLEERKIFYEDTKSQVDDLSLRIQETEDKNKIYEERIANISNNLEESEKKLDADHEELMKLKCEKDDLQQQLINAVRKIEDDKETIESRTSEIEHLTRKLLIKAEDVTNLQAKNLVLVQEAGEQMRHLKDTQNAYNLELKENEILKETRTKLDLKISELQHANEVANTTIESLHSERIRTAEQFEEDKKAHQMSSDMLKQQLAEFETIANSLRQNLREKSEETEILHRKVSESDAELETVKDEVIRIRHESNENKQLIEAEMSQQKEKYNREIQEMRVQLTAAEKASAEISLRFKYQLEAKQAELTSHLQEISQRNNQEMADMRRKYEAQTREAAAEEKQKGESALETIKRESELQLSRKLDEAKNVFKRAQKDHEDMVRIIKEANEEEKEKLKALHAEELEKKQHELSAETTKRCDNITEDFQQQIMELQKSHQEEVIKLQALLLETAEEVASMKEQLEKLKDDHIKDLASKIQEMNSRYNLRSREHEAEIVRLEMECTKIIEEWKSRALFYEVKLRTGCPEAGLVEEVLVSNPSNSGKIISDRMGESDAKEGEPQIPDKADFSRSNVLKTSGRRLSAVSSTPRDDMFRPADSAGHLGRIEKKQTKTQRNSKSSNPRAKNPKDKQSVNTHRDSRQQKNALVLTSTGLTAEKSQLQGASNSFINLEDSEDKEVASNLSTPSKMVGQCYRFQSHTDQKDSMTRRRKIGSRAAGQNHVEKTKKRVKFIDNQQSDVRSKTLSDFFQLDDLMDPYDDPYNFDG